MSSKEIVIDVRNLCKRYEIYDKPRDRLKQLVVPQLHRFINCLGVNLGVVKHSYPPIYFREFWALKNVSFQIRRGETFGIIGRNGSGKSTLLQTLAGTLAPTSGDIKVNGRIAALLELGSGFNPDFTGRENVFLNGHILGLSQRDIEARYDQIVEFADIGEFIDQPVKTYSSGMFVRLAFSVQAHIDASIVIIDEALAVGDVFFRQKCYARLEKLRNSGAAILLVSHAMTEIEQFCERAILLDRGEVKFIGSATDAAKHYYLLDQEHQAKDKTAFEIDLPYSREELNSFNKVMNFWPTGIQFKDAEELVQISNGWGKCTRFTVCDESGTPSSTFEQGEVAIFYYEFQVSKSIAVPLAGIVLKDERGINVHGKGSLEYGDPAPNFIPSGSIIRCRQRVELKLAIGEYTYELGLAAIDPESYQGMSGLSHEQLFSRIYRICHLPKAGVISVGWRRVHKESQLTHHGIADLPGSFDFEFITKAD